MTSHHHHSLPRLISKLENALGDHLCIALDDPGVVEIMLNPDGKLFIERLGHGVAAAGEMTRAAAETVIGRGRLLHASHQHAHAARALRVATATRLAARLGVPRGAPPEQLHAALVRAGVPADRAQDLLWGDPPTTDKDLVALAADLTDLEESIRHD